MTSGATARDVLDRYCVTCHNARLRTAGVVLDRDAAHTDDVGASTELWEKVARKMRARAMPPSTTPRRPDEDEYARFTTWLEDALDRHAAAHPNPGRRVVHRLNRAEYANAVRDLLGVEVDARAYLPPDDSGYGFDNIADVLSVSPGLLERYLLAAGKIGRLALGDPTVKPSVATYRVPTLFAQDDRASEDLPFGSRGGLAVRHHFPGGRRVRDQGPAAAHLHRADPRDVGAPHARCAGRPRAGQVVHRGSASRRDADPDAERWPAMATHQLEVRVTAKAGVAVVGAAFVKEAKVAEGVFLPRPPLASFEYSGKSDTEPAVDADPDHRTVQRRAGQRRAPSGDGS